MIKENGPAAKAASENIQFLSGDLDAGMTRMTALNHDSIVDWNATANLIAPYDYFYHFRRLLWHHAASVLNPAQKAGFEVLLNYVNETQGKHFDEVDATFAEGKVRQDYLNKLFGPKDLIVTYGDRYPCAYTVERSTVASGQGVRLDCWSWVYDGGFRKAEQTIHVPWPASRNSIIPITDLAAWPLRLDNSDLQQRLEERGRDFWSCRHRRYVTYVAPIKTIFEQQTVSDLPAA